MIKKYYGAILLSFLLALAGLMGACTRNSKKQSEENRNIISQEQFVNVMVDVRLAESIIRLERVKGRDTKVVTKQLYSSIFKKYHINAKRFNASVKYYASQPKLMYDIDEKVVERLSDKEAEVKAQKKLNRKE